MRKFAEESICEEDRAYYLQCMTRDNILKQLEHEKVYNINYRIVQGDKLCYVRTKLMKMLNCSGNKVLMGYQNIDALARRELEYKKTAGGPAARRRSQRCQNELPVSYVP